MKYLVLAILSFFSLLALGQNNTTGAGKINVDSVRAAKKLINDSIANQPKIYISANFGFSAPDGNYQLSDPHANAPHNYYGYETGSPQGFAGSGYCANITGGISFSFIPLEGQLFISNTVNSLDVYDLMCFLTIPGNGNAWVGTQLSQPFTSVSYNHYTVMPGIDASVKGRYVSFDWRFMFGYAYTNIPSFNMFYSNAYYNPGNQYVMTVNGVNCYSGVFDIGMGMKAYITDNVFLAANLDVFISSVLDINSINVSFNQPVNINANSIVTSDKLVYQPSDIFQINGTLGIGYAFPYQKK